MTSLPTTLDGATVLKVAQIYPETRSRAGHTVDGEEIEGIVALALARYSSEAQIYLFYCDENWTVLTDTCHEGVEAAVAQARFEFGQVNFVDVRSD